MLHELLPVGFLLYPRSCVCFDLNGKLLNYLIAGVLLTTLDDLCYYNESKLKLVCPTFKFEF